MHDLLSENPPAAGTCGTCTLLMPPARQCCIWLLSLMMRGTWLGFCLHTRPAQMQAPCGPPFRMRPARRQQTLSAGVFSPLSSGCQGMCSLVYLVVSHIYLDACVFA